MLRQLALQFVLTVGLLTTVAGCGDTATLPGERAPSQHQQSTAGTCCDPVIVIVPQCDPYMQLDFSCEGGGGGDCASSFNGTDNLASCGDTGGGAPGLPGKGTTPKGPKPPCPDYGCVPQPPDTCDPQLDPAHCYKPLTAADSATIASALAQYLRPPSSIPDSVARRACETMHNAFNTLRSSGRVFRGAYTTYQGDQGAVPHTGAWDPNTQKMHIDPKYLDRAAMGVPDHVRELIDTLLHESAHALGRQHPNGYIATQWGPLFSDPYFNLLSPGANSCLVW